MPKYAARVDANQVDVVDALRKAGASVQHLHAVGKGCPDLLVGFRGYNFLIEVKDGKKPPSKRALTDDQEEWHASWQGRVEVALNEEEALRIIFSANTPDTELLELRGTVT